MKMENIKKHWYIIVIFVLFCFNIFLMKCNTNEKELSDFNKLKAEIYFNDLQEFKKKYNDLGEIVATQKSIIIEQSKGIDKALQENSLLKAKIDNQVKIIQKLEVKNKEIMANIQPTAIKDTVYFPIGSRFDLQEDCFQIQSRLIKTGLLIENFSAQTDVIVTIDKNKNVSARLTNRCISIANLSSIYQKDKEKWYNNKWLWFGVGALVGLGATAGAVYLIK